MKKEYDYDDLPYFITKDEMIELVPRALEYFKEFILDDGYEEEYFEIQIGDRFFDLNLWDEEGGNRRGRCSASVYPTYETFVNGGGRETDGSQWVTLFSWSKVQ